MNILEHAVVRRSIAVPVTRERAFDFFANRMIEWWPQEFTFSESRLDAIAIDRHEGGRWFETDSAGSETVWGVVHEYVSPERIVLSWRISPERTPEPDESRASLVTVTFAELGGTLTRIDLEHSRFDRHGDGAAIMRDGMDSVEGWTKILERFACRIVDNSEQAF